MTDPKNVVRLGSATMTHQETSDALAKGVRPELQTQFDSFCAKMVALEALVNEGMKELQWTRYAEGQVVLGEFAAKVGKPALLGLISEMKKKGPDVRINKFQFWKAQDALAVLYRKEDSKVPISGSLQTLEEFEDAHKNDVWSTEFKAAVATFREQKDHYAVVVQAVDTGSSVLISIPPPSKAERKQVPVARACTNCRAFDVKLWRCTRCQNVLYCSSACQKEHWTTIHKLECAKS